MAFWSGETLLEKLPGLITPFNPDNIDCASYTLTIGREIYVSPTEETPDPKSTTKQLLGSGEAFLHTTGAICISSDRGDRHSSARCARTDFNEGEDQVQRLGQRLRFPRRSWL